MSFLCAITNDLVASRICRKWIPHHHLFKRMVPLSMFLTLCVSQHTAMADATLSTLASFGGSTGAYPGTDSLIAGGNGLLYGLTTYGGAYGYGTVYTFNPTTSTLNTLTSFNGPNGAYPAHLVSDISGNLFGVTTYGGSGFTGVNETGYGTLFEIPMGSNSITPLAAFSNTNGRNPEILVADKSGNLFGTTANGGANNLGTVFEVAAGTTAINALASFNGANGRQTQNGLVLDGAGNLYGTTPDGGAFGGGTIFKVAAGSDTITTLASLNGAVNGANPGGLTMNQTGTTLYASAYNGGPNGCGSIISVPIAGGSISTVAAFNFSNGYQPRTAVIADAVGNIYGTTIRGGPNDGGTIFKVAAGTGNITTLATFGTGEAPNALIADSSGTLYGVTSQGGTSNAGTLFKITGSGFVPSIQTQPVTRTPVATLTHLYIPPATQVISTQGTTIQVSNPNLLVYSGGVLAPGGTIDRSEPTVVLTHGWNDFATSSTFHGFVQQYATIAGANINILAWDWSADANTLNPGTAASRAPNEGAALGESLITALGPNYQNSIHFIGHSLGTLVNATAADVFNSHEADASKTQVTLFDDAESANLFAGILPTSSVWASSTPNIGSAIYIDNYISAYGYVRTNAANLILTQGPTAISPIAFHFYPIDWYASTIGPAGNALPMGYRWAIEKNNLPNDTRPLPGTIYLQSLNPLDSPLTITDPISVNTASAVLIARNTVTIPATIGDLTVDGIINAVTYVGHVALDLIPGLNANGQTDLKPRVTLTEHSPSYAWIPITLPSNAQEMSFDFVFQNLDPSDYLTVGINVTQLFALESEFISDGATNSSGYLDVSQWAGQNVELFLGLNSTGDAPGGTMTVENIEFASSVPEPTSLALLLLGTVGFLLRRQGLFRVRP